MEEEVRPIKFRAWDKRTRRIIPPNTFMDYVFTSKQVKIKIDENSWEIVGGPMPDLFFNPNIELMQFTGIKDKNGVDLYEGDIVQDDGNYPGGVKYLGVIKFGGFKKSPAGFWSDASVFGTPDGLKISEFAEVVGNIHENPELLK